MCVVSRVISDWLHPTWPNPVNPNTAPWKPPISDTIPAPWIPPTVTTTTNSIPWSTIQSDPKLAEQMLEVLKKLEAIDKRLGMLEQCKVSADEKKKLKSELRKIARKKK